MPPDDFDDSDVAPLPIQPLRKRDPLEVTREMVITHGKELGDHGQRIHKLEVTVLSLSETLDQMAVGLDWFKRRISILRKRILAAFAEDETTQKGDS